jgi:2,3-bisphosphoglycerate-independent phosphoglycerate mutase
MSAQIAEMPEKSKAVLLILDGMGLNENPDSSATTAGNMPYVHQLMERYGFARLGASGSAVGLDETETGNSEVGHLTIGAGRVIPSTLGRIRQGYENGSWVGSRAWDKCDLSRPLHLAGLLSDAGVHAHWETLTMAAKLGVKKGFPAVYIHALLDGTDSQAGTAPQLLADLEQAIADNGDERIKLASVMGRKWATDRAGNWDLTRHCRDGLMGRLESGVFRQEDLQQHLESFPSEASFPHAFMPGGVAVAPGDSVILTNHRADRISQLAKLMNEECHVMAMVELKHEATPLEDVFFPTQTLTGGLVDVLKERGYSTVRLSEQCKFPHVTYFINGMRADDSAEGVEVPTIADDEILSNPAMSIAKLGDELHRLMARGSDGQVLIVNVPNLDQVGHQGSLEAATKAAEAVDDLVEKVVESWCKENGWHLLITADHGNADIMVDDRGRPMGSHTSNDVPMLAIACNDRQIEWRKHSGSLTNVAASLLTLLGTDYPDTMTESLIELH